MRAFAAAVTYQIRGAAAVFFLVIGIGFERLADWIAPDDFHEDAPDDAGN